MKSAHAPTAQHLLARLGLVCIAVSSMLLSAHAQSAEVNTTTPKALPQLGSSGSLSLGQELAIGQAVARSMYRDPDYFDDPLLVEYTGSIWGKLLAAGRMRNLIGQEQANRFAWQLLLGQDSTINAFAVPGGFFGLQLGLIAITSTRDELASVLAHEISHITQQHISRADEKQRQLRPLVIASMIAAGIAASKNPEAAHAAIAGTHALSLSGQLAYSRDMEREADRMGFSLLSAAGYAPEGFVSMFDKLHKANRLRDDGSFPYLRTHPLTTERIADMRARTQQSPTKPTISATLAPDTVHLLFAARANVLRTQGIDSQRAHIQQGLALLKIPAAPNKYSGAASVTPALVPLYSAAVAAIALREWDAAQQLSQAFALRVKSAYGNQFLQADYLRLANLLAAEIALAQKDYAQVLQRINSYADFRRPEFVLQQQALMAKGDAASLARAQEALERWTRDQPTDALAWNLLGQVYQQRGQAARAVRMQASAAQAQYDYELALERLKSARKLARRDDIEASVIEAQIRRVQELLDAQNAYERDE